MEDIDLSLDEIIKKNRIAKNNQIFKAFKNTNGIKATVQRVCKKHSMNRTQVALTGDSHMRNTDFCLQNRATSPLDFNFFGRGGEFLEDWKRAEERGGCSYIRELLASRPDVAFIWHASNDLQRLLHYPNEVFHFVMWFWKYLEHQNITTYVLELPNRPKFGEKYKFMSRRVNKNLLESLPSGRLILLPKEAHDPSGYGKDGVHLKDAMDPEESLYNVVADKILATLI